MKRREEEQENRAAWSSRASGPNFSHVRAVKGVYQSWRYESTSGGGGGKKLWEVF